MSLYRLWPTIACLAMLASISYTCGCGTAPHEHPEDISLSEISTDLAQDPEIEWRHKFADVKLRGKMHYDWFKAKKGLQPADEAIWPVTITFEEAADGSHSVTEGSAIYSCPPGATGPWRYNRFRFDNNDRIGVKAPPREELRTAVLSDMRSRTTFWFRPDSMYVGVREVSIPENLEYKSSSPTSDSFNVEVVADREGSSRVDRLWILFRAERTRGDDNRFRFGLPKVRREEILSSQEFSPGAIRSMPNLANTSFDRLFTTEEVQGEPALAIPDEKELIGAVWQVTIASNNNLDQIFRKKSADRDTAKRICRIEKPVLRPGFAPKYWNEGERLQVDIVYSWMEKTGSNEGTVYKAPFQFLFRRRSQPVTQSPSRLPANGSSVLSKYECVKLMPKGQFEVVETKSFSNTEAAEALKSIWERTAIATQSSRNESPLSVRASQERAAATGLGRANSLETTKAAAAVATESRFDRTGSASNVVAVSPNDHPHGQRKSNSDAARSNTDQDEPSIEQAAADSVRIAVLRNGYEMRICAETGKQLGKFHTGEKANDIAISGDGQRIAVLRDQYEVKLYDTAGKLLGRFKPGDKLQAIALNGDGSRIVVLQNGYKVFVFDDKGVKLADFHTGDKAQDVAMSSDGKRIAVLRDEYHVKLFDPAGQLLSEFKPGSKLQALALNGDGTRIAILRDSYEVCICNDAGKRLGNIKTGGGAHDSAVSDDGNWLAVVRDQQEVILFHSSGSTNRIKLTDGMQRVSLGIVRTPKKLTAASLHN